jgi:hypothetical protein
MTQKSPLADGSRCKSFDLQSSCGCARFAAKWKKSFFFAGVPTGWQPIAIGPA